VVDLVPPGKVATYGDIAEYLGRGGPRQVGAVMARWGGAVAWWRVVRAGGAPVVGYEQEALRRLTAEGTPLRPGGDRVDLARARWSGEVDEAVPRDHLEALAGQDRGAGPDREA